MGANKISGNLKNGQELFRKMEQGLERRVGGMNSTCGGLWQEERRQVRGMERKLLDYKSNEEHPQ